VITVALASLALVVAALAYYEVRQLRKLNPVLSALYKRVSAVDLAIQRVEKNYELDEQIRRKLKRLEAPSTELQEFLQDIIESGCGIIRIHPDSIFVRGLKK
jgi:hypothetical protein